jgi:putative tricarboxylic transport membrane protein
MKYIDSKDKVGSSFVLLFALIYLNAAFDIPLHQSFGDEVFTARTLPFCLAALAIIVCLLQMFMPSRDLADESISDAITGFNWKPCLLLTGLMLLYGLSFEFLGFAISTFLFLFVGFAILGEKRYLLSAAIAGGVAVFMWSVLTQLFDIYLDSGALLRAVVGD